MIRRIWDWLFSPRINVELVKPESRIGFQLMGAPSHGWFISEDYLRIQVSGAGTVQGVHVTIDGFIVWTVRTDECPVCNGDTMCYSLVNILRKHMRIEP